MSTAPEHAFPVWSFDPRDGALQGPLDLQSFAEGGLRLRLGPGQTALLIEADEPRASWTEGQHELRIGRGDDRLAPDAHLFMIATDTPLSCRWGDALPLRDAAVRGGCAFLISDPVRFHAAFLRRGGTLGLDLVRRLLGALVQARLGDLLAASPDAPAIRLAGVTRDDLAAGWDELGVTLAAFACDAPATAGPAAPAAAGHPVFARV